MQNEAETIRRLSTTNRFLKFGYVILGVFGVVGYSLAAPQSLQPGATDPNSNGIPVDRDQVGDVQQLVAVDHEEGFAVMIDEEGKVNVIRKDGTVIVAKRKFFPDQVSD